MAQYLKAVWLDDTIQDETDYYVHLPAVRALAGAPLAFTSPATFLVGENGTGKSTLLEAIAVSCGFNPEGGTINFNFASKETHSGLHSHLLTRRGPIRQKDGFFLRAESFYNVSSEVERLKQNETLGGRSIYESYGGKSLHQQSHGESFMALVLNRFGGNGLYILDEPEAALSPTRQLALLTALHDLVQRGSQLIISTHSPILMALPGAQIYGLGAEGITPQAYTQTEHYQVTKQFLNDTQRMLDILLEE